MPLPLPNPLLALHRAARAELQPYDQLDIVSTFGQPEAEYSAIRKACALMDQPQRGLLELTGRDRLEFLNNLVTNQTWDKSTRTGLAPGAGVYAFFLNTKGRIVTDLNVLELGDRTLVELDARLVDPLRESLGKFIFSEKVHITSQLGRLHQLSLLGPGVPDLLTQLGVPSLPPSPLSSLTTTLLDTPVIIWRDDPSGVPACNLILPLDAAERLWTELVRRFPCPSPDRLIDSSPALRVRPVGWAAFNATRVEAGRPIFGIDFTDTILPAETGQFSRAVSITKGCYLGQEIVARMHARGQLAKQLVGIRMDSDALPIAGALVYDSQNNEIGGVTSSTISPVLSNAAICLAYLKKPFFSPGASVTIPAEGALRPGHVVPTPFI